MAQRKRKNASRTRRNSGGNRRRRSTRANSSRRGRSGSTQTVRIVLEGVGAPAPSLPGLGLVQKPVTGKRGPRF